MLPPEMKAECFSSACPSAFPFLASAYIFIREEERIYLPNKHFGEKEKIFRINIWKIRQESIFWTNLRKKRNGILFPIGNEKKRKNVEIERISKDLDTLLGGCYSLKRFSTRNWRLLTNKTKRKGMRKKSRSFFLVSEGICIWACKMFWNKSVPF